MAKNKSYNDILNLQEDWGLDIRNNLPYSGKSVQAFIKKMIRDVIADLGGKHGYVSYESGRMVFYSEEGGTQLGAVTITGTSYSINVSTNLPTSNFTVLTSDEKYPITITPTTTSMEFGSTEQNEYPEDYTFKVEVDNGLGYIDRTPENNNIKQGGTATIDIRPYLKTGTNRIRIVVLGVSSEQPKTVGYTATLTSLSLSCAHPWHQAWIQGQEFAIKNIFFSGNIAKVLHVKVGDKEYTKEYTASTSYDKVPTTFDLTNFTPESSGVVPIELWITGDAVETKHIHYNIMYIAVEDIGNISLICTNNVKSTVYNFTEETLLEYAVYNINSLTTNVVAKVKDTGVVLLDSTQNVLAQTVYPLKLSLQIDTVEIGGITLDVVLSSDETFVEEYLNVDNSNAYLSTEGYKFYLNTSLGNNDSADREYIQNSAIVTDEDYKTIYPSIWTNFTFADDAWTTDAKDGNRALVVKAGAFLEVKDLKPLQFSNNKSATIEFMFKASNIADYDKPIITCIDTEEYNSNSVGFAVFPNKIVLLGTETRQELFQKLPLSEDRIHHIVIVIQRGYSSTSLNLARIYINGCENVTFSFGGGNTFYNRTGNNNLRIGQASTDSYLYMMRIYDKALESGQVFSNYLNALIETTEVSRKGLREDNNIIDGNQLSYDLCKKAGFNILVIEIEGDKPVPSLKNPIEYSKGCNYHFEYNDNPEWNVSIYNAPMDRQGTTSSLYYWSNLRSKIKEKVRWVYHNLKDSSGNTLEEISKDGYIAGYGLNPKVSKITWKKNIASQSQGHKMGATALYNDIYKRIMRGAEQLVKDQILPTTGARVSVYQHPFIAFQRFSNGTEKCLGLFTGGPDKTDKKTFGYNETDKYPNLMMIEGPNHDPYLTRFLVPWTDDVFYDYSAETLSVGAKSASEGSKQEGWDADIVADYSTDKESDAQAILDLYKSEFKPAYDAIYYNSLYIASLEESGKTLNEINSDISEFHKGKTRGYSNTLMTFYDNNYNLIYYRVKTRKYEILPKTTHNLLEYLGLSGTPTTEDILEARKAKWLNSVGTYVNMREAYYRQIFDEFIGASDNDAKNSYWRKFLSIALGGKWGFNEDDLDTILQNDNNGQDTKDYFVEPDDTSSLGADIFQGRTSAFWYALRQICKDQLKGMMFEFVDAMYKEAESKNILSTDSIHQTIFNVIDYYFWRSSSKYFSATAYNYDTQLAYIDVWYEAPDAVYNNVPPLTQIHGDHYETEREWVSKRIPYMFSKYQIGAFRSGDADGYGSLEFTPAEAFTMEVTPAIDLYPRVSYGGSITENSVRTKAGQTCPLVLSASGTTGNYIKAMDWLSSIGDLSDLKLSPRSAADASISFSVKGKRLRSLKVGDNNKLPEDIKFNAATLGVESDALEVIDARNTSSITGSLDLQKCPRLKEVYLSGTNISTVIPPTGGRITKLQLPSTLQTLILNNLNLLTEEGLEIPESTLVNVENFYINSCDNINAVNILKSIYETPNNRLYAIGIVWKGWLIDEDGSILRMFGDIAKKAIDYGLYAGAYFDGGLRVENLPNISGSLDASNLKGVYKEDIENIQRALPGLKLKFNSDNFYISFEDKKVQRICATNWGDGTGITEAQVEAVDIIDTQFTKNTEITTFNELEKFTKLFAIVQSSSLGDYHGFNGCTSLQSIRIPNSVTELGRFAFTGCVELSSINLPTDLTFIGLQCFYNCKKITNEINLPKLATLSGGAFYGTAIERVISLGAVTIIPGSNNINYAAFANCKNLKSIGLLNKITEIGANAFNGCTSLEIDDLNLPNLETLGQNAFYGVKIKKISDLGTITTLPTATTWTQNFGDKSVLEEVVLPNSVSALESYAFYNYTALKKINLDNITIMNDHYHFKGCTSLEGDYIINATRIGGESFMNTKITSVYCPYIQNVDFDAFENCKSLKVAHFGSNLTTIGAQIFLNCSALERVIIEAVMPPSAGETILKGASNCPIYVPDASVEKYKTTANWSAYADRILPLSQYNE